MRNDIFSELPRQHSSELDFDLALVGAARAPFNQHVEGCAACRDRLARLRSEQDSFAASDRPVRAARIIFTARHRSLTAWLRPKWFFSFAGAAIVTASVALLLRTRPTDEIRTKGGPVIDAYVKRGNTPPIRWSGNEGLQAGDAVQISYRSAGSGRLVSVFSVEKGCQAKLEFSAPAADQGLIPNSWSLTGPSGLLYAAFSNEPIGVDDFSRTLRSTLHGCDGSSAPAVESQTFTARGIALRSSTK